MSPLAQRLRDRLERVSALAADLALACGEGAADGMTLADAGELLEQADRAEQRMHQMVALAGRRPGENDERRAKR